MCNRYQVVLFALDGDWVVDHASPTKEEAIEKLCNQGSRWFFYPYAFLTTYRKVTSSRQRVIAHSDLLPELDGRSIKTVSKFLARQDQDWHTMMLI